MRTGTIFSNLKKGYFYPKIKKMIIFIKSYDTDDRND